MFLYDFVSNAILSKPLKSRQASELTTTSSYLHKNPRVSNGFTPAINILDNECSEELKKALRKNHVDFQRVPPHSHRRNAAEATRHPNLEESLLRRPRHLRSQVSTHRMGSPPAPAELTLNLLRWSCCQPRLLAAYACLKGNFDSTIKVHHPSPLQALELLSTSSYLRKEPIWHRMVSTVGTLDPLPNTTDATSVTFPACLASAML